MNWPPTQDKHFGKWMDIDGLMDDFRDPWRALSRQPRMAACFSSGIFVGVGGGASRDTQTDGQGCGSYTLHTLNPYFTFHFFSFAL